MVGRRHAGFVRLVATLLLSVGLTMALTSARGEPGSDEACLPEIGVGIEKGDIQGADNRALQAAVDYVAGLGGGTVHIEPGRYAMRNALRLRDNVRILGVPGKTILAACEGFKSRLACDGDCNQSQITVVDASGFRLGDGVVVWDNRFSGGFTVTTATLTARVDTNTFSISAPLYLDYMVSQDASAALAFPVVGGWGVRDASIEGVVVEGNRPNSRAIDGCRGGGIYLFECERIAIRKCTVRGYNGDGISFQVSHHVTVEDCFCQNNAGHGLHPGSGSQCPELRRNRSTGNDRDGMYVCWRVKHGVFENNELQNNKGVGMSIGHKDTDNVFRQNKMVGNGGAGVEFRRESEPMGAHRNLFENNVILDNGFGTAGRPARACVVMRGNHNDVVFRKNLIGNSKPDAPVGVGIFSDKNVQRLDAEDNEFRNVKTAVEAVE
jgi:hypothetical protein